MECSVLSKFNEIKEYFTELKYLELDKEYIYTFSLRLVSFKLFYRIINVSFFLSFIFFVINYFTIVRISKAMLLYDLYPASYYSRNKILSITFGIIESYGIAIAGLVFILFLKFLRKKLNINRRNILVGSPIDGIIFVFVLILVYLIMYITLKSSVKGFIIFLAYLFSTCFWSLLFIVIFLITYKRFKLYKDSDDILQHNLVASLIRCIWLCKKFENNKRLSQKEKDQIIFELSESNNLLKLLFPNSNVKFLDDYVYWIKKPQQSTVGDIALVLIKYLIPVSNGYYHYLPTQNDNKQITTELSKYSYLLQVIFIMFPIFLGFILYSQDLIKSPFGFEFLLLFAYVSWLYVGFRFFKIDLYRNIIDMLKVMYSIIFKSDKA